LDRDVGRKSNFVDLDIYWATVEVIFSIMNTAVKQFIFVCGAIVVFLLLPSHADAQSFSLSAGSATIAQTQGAGAVSNTIVAVPSGGFASAVSFSVTGIPADTTYVFSPGSCTPNCTTTLTFSPGFSAGPGSYSIVVMGVGGGFTAYAYFTFNVIQAPSFSLSSGGGIVIAQGGGFGTSTITASYDAGFSEAVTLSASNLPAGASYSFSPGATCTGTCTRTLTITTDASTPVGVSNIMITGAGGAFTKYTYLNLTVSGFELSNAGDVTAQNEGVNQNNIIATLGFAAPTTATFTVSGLPPDGTATFNPSACSFSCTTVLEITTMSTTPVGVYTINVTGVAGSITRTTSYVLNLVSGTDITNGAPLITDPNGNTVQLLRAREGGAAVNNNIYYDDGPDDLGSDFSVSGLPADTTASFSQVNCAASCTTVLTITTGAPTPAGSYVITVTSIATNGFQDSTNFTLVVVPFFTLSHNGSVNIAEGGGSVTRTITVASVFPAVPAVALTASGLPSGATAVFAPVSCAPSPTCTSTLTLTIDPSTPVGEFDITVAGTGGGFLNTTIFAFIVQQAFDLYNTGAVYVAAGSVATSIINAVQNFGAPVPLAFTVSGNPSGTTPLFSPTICAPSCGTVLVIPTFTTTPQQEYTITVTATGGGISKSTSFSLNVTPPSATAFDFTLVSGGSVSVYRGSSAVTGITAELIYGGTPSPVNFSVSGVPSDVVAAFSLTSCTPTCTTQLTFTANAAAPIGTSLITVTAMDSIGNTIETQFSLAVGSSYTPSTNTGLKGGFGWIRFDSTGPYPCSGTCRTSCRPNEDQDTLAMCTATGQMCCAKRGNDPKENTSAATYIDLSTAEKSVKGWAQYCSALSSSNCSGSTLASAATGNWDGWLQMRGASPRFGVRLIDDGKQCKLAGWAWGSSDNYNYAYDIKNRNIGWMSFNCENGSNGEPDDLAECTTSDYGIKIDADKINFTSSPTNLKAAPDFVYKLTPEEELIEFSWDFYGICQDHRGFELQLSLNSSVRADGSFTSTLYRDPQCPAGVAACCSEKGYCSAGSTPRLTYHPFSMMNLPDSAFGNRVYWHVRSKAAARQSNPSTYILSGCSSVASVSIPTSLFPTGVDMIVTPKLPSIGQTATIKSTATCYNVKMPAGCSSYKWTFDSVCDPKPSVRDITTVTDFTTTVFNAQCLSYGWVMPTGIGNICASSGAWQCPETTNIEVGNNGGNRKTLLGDQILKIIPEWREVVPKQ
jgi:hypothetical protein